jgi:ATP-dependent RNA helicase DDX1
MPCFEELGLVPEILRAVDDLNWLLPSDVQDEAIPLILGGGDVMAAAETGSGKTGAFGLPVVQVVYETRRDGPSSRARPGAEGAQKGGGALPADSIRLSVDDRDTQFAVSPTGFDCQSRAPQNWCGARATVGVTSGKHYYEAQVSDEGLCRIGWSTIAAKLDVGTDAHSWGFGGTGKKSHNKKFEDYGNGGYGKGQIVGTYVDLEAGTIGYTKDGADLGVAFQLPHGFKGPLYPAVVLKNAEMSFNFGLSPFAHAPKPGFAGISAARPGQFVTADPGGGGGGGGGRGGKSDKGGQKNTPLAIIIEPTRDLAEQVPMHSFYYHNLA